jgi:hypothetical protein
MPLALVGLIALFSALLALAFSGGHSAQAHTTHEAKGTIAKQELTLRNDMRKLWEDHITWTRLAIVSLVGDLADTQPTVGRLLQNQTDIGNAIKPYYGKTAGAALTRLLREHIVIAADIIAAAKAENQSALAESQSRWQKNADEIATLLSKANPRSWKLNAMTAMLRDHLRLTTREAVARLQGDWAADVAAYDEIHRQALHMADMLSGGIVRQFPGRFR